MKQMKRTSLWPLVPVIALLVVIFNSCSEDDQAPLSVLEISPLTGFAGAEVTVSGTGFSIEKSENEVTFNGKPAIVISTASTKLVVIAPNDGTTGPVAVQVKEKEATQKPVFTYIEQPDSEISITCEPGKSITIEKLNIIRIQKMQYGYTISYEFEIENNGSEALNLNKLHIQNYISVNGTFGDSDDYAAAGYATSYDGLDVAASKIIKSSANTSLLPDPFQLHGFTLFVDIEFPSRTSPECSVVIENKIQLE